MRIGVVAAAVCLSIVGISAGAEAVLATRQPTNIAAQELAPALETLARERDVQVVYRSELVGRAPDPRRQWQSDIRRSTDAAPQWNGAYLLLPRRRRPSPS